MNGEAPYRVVLILIAVVQNGLAGYSLRNAGAISSIFQRRSEGVWLSLGIGASFLAFCGAMIVYLVNPAWMTWSGLPFAPAARWSGLAPLMCGSALIVWGTRHLAENFTMSVETKSSHKLITTGPYRWVRHPLYSGLLIEALGVSLFVANWFVAGSAAATWALLAVRTRIEEDNLVEKFGGEYREYQARAGMFIPRLSRPRR